MLFYRLARQAKREQQRETKLKELKKNVKQSGQNTPNSHKPAPVQVQIYTVHAYKIYIQYVCTNNNTKHKNITNYVYNYTCKYVYIHVHVRTCYILCITTL